MRTVNGTASGHDGVSHLHRDRLQSATLITGLNAATVQESYVRPYGDVLTQPVVATTQAERRGWVGERLDQGPGLQFLNAR